jgi:hypothetical protein
MAKTLQIKFTAAVVVVVTVKINRKQKKQRRIGKGGD